MNPEPTIQMPAQWSTIAPEVDYMYYFIYWVSVVFTIGIFGSMGWFMWKYRRRPGVKAKPTGHNFGLEIFWTFTPLLLLAYLFHAGFQGYLHGTVVPDDHVEIRVRGMQWNWEFEHPGGVIDTYNELKVPVNKPVQLIMSSNDVLHSFYVPLFRVKRDVVPGMYTSLWFEATHTTGEVTGCTQDAQCGEGQSCYYGNCIAQCQQDSDCWEAIGEGSWCGGQVGDETRICALPVFCAEYCGAGSGITRSAFDDPDGSGRNTNHSTMMADLRIISQEGYDRFLEVGPPPPAECATTDATCEGEECKACWGQSLYQSSGCSACHSSDGSPGPAPTWQGLWENQRTFMNGAEPAVADRNYIRESILNPQARIVEGFGNVAMPAYRLSDNQIDAIIAYIQTLSE